MYRLKSSSPEETLRIGRKLGGLLSGKELLALEGEMGTGKTLFAKGIIQGLGIKDEIRSPTYTIIHEYYHLFPVYHMDLYRIEEGEELFNLGFEEYLYGDGVIIIEWPFFVLSLFPIDYLKIQLVWEGNQERTLSFFSQGEGYEVLLKELRDCVGSGT